VLLVRGQSDSPTRTGDVWLPECHLALKSFSSSDDKFYARSQSREIVAVALFRMSLLEEADILQTWRFRMNHRIQNIKRRSIGRSRDRYLTTDPSSNREARSRRVPCILLVDELLEL